MYAEPEALRFWITFGEKHKKINARKNWEHETVPLLDLTMTEEGAGKFLEMPQDNEK